MGSGSTATCDSCGMQYNSAWAKEQAIKIKGEVVVSEPVKVDSSHLIGNYLNMARNATGICCYGDDYYYKGDIRPAMWISIT